MIFVGTIIVFLIQLRYTLITRSKRLALALLHTTGYMMKKDINHPKTLLRWGIIGPGQIAHQFVEDMQYATACRNEVSGVMSLSLYEAKEFASQYLIPYYSDKLEDMLKQSKPDVVYIATPHSAHFNAAAECLQHKIPVLCEKPFALNETQGSELIDLSRKNDTFFMEGMWIRFLPDIKRLAALLEQKVIGDLNSLVADMSYCAPRDRDNRFYDPALGGGSLLDLGIYPLYLALITLGVPSGVKATALLTPEAIDRSCAMMLEYDNSAYALLESSIIKETSRTAVFFGSLGRIIIESPWNEKPEGIIVHLYDGAKKTYPCQWEGRGFQLEMDEVAACLLEGHIESTLHSHAESLKLLRLMDEIRNQTGILYPADGKSSG